MHQNLLPNKVLALVMLAQVRSTSPGCSGQICRIYGMTIGKIINNNNNNDNNQSIKEK
jgi:hypothetical protein